MAGDNYAVQYVRQHNQVPWLPSRDLYVRNQFGVQKICAYGSDGSFDSGCTGGVSSDPKDFRFGLYSVLYPLWLTYRHGSESPLAVSLGAMAVDDRKCLVNGVECLVIGGNSEPAPGKSRRFEMHLDPRRSFVPLRLTEAVNGQPVMQIECSFKDDQGVMPVPTSWTLTVLTLGTGRLSVTETVSVEAFEVNKKIDETRFRIDFPPGIPVTVGTNPVRERVRPDGTVPGFAYVDVMDQSSGWWWMLGMAVSAVTAATYLGRRWMRLRFTGS
jgi:hypothetical protein